MCTKFIFFNAKERRTRRVRIHSPSRPSFLRVIWIVILLLWSSVSAFAEQPRQSLYQIPLQWSDDNGKEFDLTSLGGKQVILTMAFASCRSACPLTIKRLKSLDKLIQESNKSAEYVIVSLDPQRDTPEAMKTFREENGLKDQKWHLLRGSEESTRVFSNLIDYNFQQNPNTKDIMHSNKLLLLNEKGEIQLVLEGLTSDLTTLVKALK